MRAITLPFSIDSYGRVSFTDDDSRAWADRAVSVVGTYAGERVMRPDFGTNLMEAFYTTGEREEAALSVAIEDAFYRHLPTLSITDVQVKRSEGSPDNLLVNVVYSVPGRNDPLSVDITTPSITLQEV